MPNTTDDFGTSLNASGKILAGTGNPDATAASGAGFNDSKPHEFTFKRTGGTGALALYVDGALSATATGGTQSLIAPNRLVLGAQQTMLNYFTGDIAEVKIFNSALSDNDRVSQENDLIYKWGIRALPSLALTGVNAGANSFIINWPATANGWGLYFATNLAPPVIWSPVTNQFGSNAEQFNVTLPFDLSAKFFRLASP
jgi:hypothetical protein